MPDLCWNSTGLPEWSHLCEHTRQLQVIFQNHTLKSYTKHCYVCNIYPMQHKFGKEVDVFSVHHSPFQSERPQNPQYCTAKCTTDAFILLVLTQKGQQEPGLSHNQTGDEDYHPFFITCPWDRGEWGNGWGGQEKSFAPQGYDLLESSRTGKAPIRQREERYCL